MTTIYGVDVSPAIDSCIRPDGWRFGSRLTPSTWEAAGFYLPTQSMGPITALAVNVVVTGRTWQHREGDLWVRVQIEFVGDGEPSTFSPGWMKQN